MALGLLFGRVNRSDPARPGPAPGYADRKKRTAWRFCKELEAELGSTQCRDIHAGLMGKEYDFLNPDSFQEFLEAGGAAYCRVPPEKAARIAAAIILDELETQKDR